MASVTIITTTMGADTMAVTAVPKVCKVAKCKRLTARRSVFGDRAVA